MIMYLSTPISNVAYFRLVFLLNAQSLNRLHHQQYMESG
nr:MAG TPA: hypothetical protein [Caudoviricetes sp.]